MSFSCNLNSRGEMAENGSLILTLGLANFIQRGGLRKINNCKRRNEKVRMIGGLTEGGVHMF
jgi:hypothetical protein